MPTLDPMLWLAVVAIALLAGLVKGAVGFAMPMILISGLGTFLSPEMAIAALILPTVLSNLWQAARGGLRNALAATREHRVYLVVVLVMIVASAQIVNRLPDGAMYLIIGVPITLFAATQLLGWRARIAPGKRRRAEVPVALFAGFMGGIAGVWGPPTVLYLTALETPKKVSVQIQGVVYLAGSIMLLAAHLSSGVLAGERATLSALLCIPAGLGMVAGFWLHDRLDQERFRQITLAVLVLAGLNLVRRGLAG